MPVRKETRPILGTKDNSLNACGAQSVVGVETCAKLMVRVSEKLPAGVATTAPVESRLPISPVHVSLEVRHAVVAKPNLTSGCQAAPFQSCSVVAVSDASPTQVGDAKSPVSRPMLLLTSVSVTVRVVPALFLNVQLLPD